MLLCKKSKDESDFFKIVIMIKERNVVKKMSNLFGIVISYIYIAIIIILAKCFEKLGKEASRKFIHIMLGNWWLIAIYFFDNAIWASFVPATFVIINYISYKKNLIKVMERDEKEGLGTVYYALSLFILSVVTFGILKKPELGLVSILVMAYGDGLAAVIGKKVKSLKYKVGDTEKSIAGSLTMFIVSFLIISIYFVFTNVTLWWLKAIILSIIITILEAVSIKGTDNITVPLGMFVMVLLV